MLGEEIDRIASKYTVVLKPRPTDKTLTDAVIVALDSEYVLPLHNPYTTDELKQKLEGQDLPTEFLEPRKPFRTFCMATQGKTARWKPDRPIRLEELCGWILENLNQWKINYREHKRIAVCAHYLISELQHIVDLKTVMTKIRTYGAGLYGEAVFEPDQWLNYNPSGYKIELEHEQIKFVFIDTYALFGMSLEKLTTGTPYEKPRDTEIWNGQQPWSYWRRNPHLLFEKDEGKFWKYAEGDVLGLEWCVNYWRKWIWGKWSIDILRTKTFSNIAFRIFQSRITEPTEPYVRKQFLSKQGRPKTELIFNPIKQDLRQFYLLGYKAGRREIYERGLQTEPVYAYDVSKEYTTSAIMQPLPNAHTEFTRINDQDDLEQYEGMVEMEFEFPDTVQIPCLPVIDGKYPKQIYPRKGHTVCGVAELRLAKKLGAKTHILDSYVFKPTEAEINHPIRQFLEDVLKIANENKGTPTETFMKNLANGLIGKLFQRNRLEKQEEKWVEQIWRVAKSWSPILASLILSRARALYGELLTLATLVYGHTDSLFTKTPIDLNAPIIQTLKQYGSEGLKLENTFTLFWTPRAACYYGRTKDGKIKVGRHGIPSETEQFIKTLEPKISNQNAQDKTVFITTKPVKLDDKKNPLGHEVLKITRTEFEYDQKRKLLEPHRNLWNESSKTTPWQSIDELLEHVKTKTKKPTTLKEGYRRSKGVIGRPKIITDEDRTVMEKMVKDGETIYRITQRFKTKYSLRTIYRLLSKSNLSRQPEEI